MISIAFKGKAINPDLGEEVMDTDPAGVHVENGLNVRGCCLAPSKWRGTSKTSFSIICWRDRMLCFLCYGYIRFEGSVPISGCPPKALKHIMKKLENNPSLTFRQKHMVLNLPSKKGGRAGKSQLFLCKETSIIEFSIWALQITLVFLVTKSKRVYCKQGKLSCTSMVCVYLRR